MTQRYDGVVFVASHMAPSFLERLRLLIPGTSIKLLIRVPTVEEVTETGPVDMSASLDGWPVELMKAAMHRLPFIGRSPERGCTASKPQGEGHGPQEDAEDAERCGEVFRDIYKGEDVPCTLPKGHEGHHDAPPDRCA